MSVYKPEYVPHNKKIFEEMLAGFRDAKHKNMLTEFALMYVITPTVPREDIYVAQRRVEKERGW
jgi:hypothetical protein